MKPNRLITYISYLCLWGLCALSCSDSFQGIGPDPANTFVKIHGGAFDETGVDILKLDTGYLLLGSTQTPDQGQKSSIYLVATNEAGEEQWTENIAVNIPDASGLAKAMVKMDDGSFLICGTASMAGGNQDLWLVKVSASGQEEWQMTYGTVGTQETGVDLALMDKGGVLLLGNTSHVDQVKPEANPATDKLDMYLVKIDTRTQGALVWEKTFGYSGVDEARDILDIGNGNFAILGTTDFPKGTGTQDKDVWITLINSDGNAWNTRVFEKDNGEEIGRKMELNASGEFVIVGSSFSNTSPNSPNLLYMRVNQDLNSETTKESILPASEGNSLLLNAKGEGVITGRSIQGSGTNSTLFLLKVDEKGDMFAFKEFGDAGLNSGSEMISTDDQNIVVIGTLDFGGNTMMMQIKTDENLTLN